MASLIFKNDNKKQQTLKFKTTHIYCHTINTLYYLQSALIKI